MIKTNVMSKQTITLSLWSVIFVATYLVISPAFDPLMFAFSLFLAGCMIWICAADLKGHRIPNIAVILIAVGGLALLLSTNTESLWQRLIDASIVLAVMSAISIAAKYLSKNKALGFGDVKLLTAATLWLGLQGIYAAALFAFTAGLIFVVVGVLVGKHKLSQPIALGPFIALGAWGSWLFTLS